MTRHCLTCQGVIAVAPDPSSPIRWCQCRGPRYGKDAEIARLRALVRRVANTDPVDYQRWDEITADAKKALDQ